VELAVSPGASKQHYRWGTAWSSASSAVAVRWPSPLPPRPLVVADPALEVFPDSLLATGHRTTEVVRCFRSGSPLVISRRSFRALVSPLGLLAITEVTSSPILSWDSPADRPSVVRPFARPLPEAEASFGPTVPPVDFSFRPRGLSPPRRLPPRSGCGFFAPRYRLWGSTRFALTAFMAVRRRPCPTEALPAPRIVPFEEFPSSAAVPHHCGRCPHGVATRPTRVHSGRSLRSYAPQPEVASIDHRGDDGDGEPTLPPTPLQSAEAGLH
jgi:hypothetical protein